jgi:hypothetical protein
MSGPTRTPAARGDSSEPSTPVTPSSGDGRIVFFDVSILKLVVLSVCSLGIYEGYWFYKNWQIVRTREGSNISPLWRAAMSFFYCHALFKRVRECDAQTGGTGRLPAGALAAGWILLTCLWLLPSPYSFATNLSCLFMVPVQAAVNRISGSAQARNRNFTVWNWLTVVLGGAILVLDALGFFAMPDLG